MEQDSSMVFNVMEDSEEASVLVCVRVWLVKPPSLRSCFTTGFRRRGRGTEKGRGVCVCVCVFKTLGGRERGG